MSARRNRSTSRALGLGVVIAAALVLLMCAPAAFAAPPKTIQGAAYEQMKEFMQKYDKDGFARVVDCGGTKAYRDALLGVKLVVDPKMVALATYDPNTKTITFSKDPRTVKADERAALGETVWHEVTHALEDENGDDFTNADPLYQDRNTWYMKQVIDGALPWLANLEKQAKKGASVEKLKAIWQKYLKAMDVANNLPETKKFPPDLALMRGWFGFKANPAEVTALYLSDKAFSGKQWANLRRALTAPVLAIGDPYQGGTVAYILQSGDPGFVAGQTHGLIAAVADQSTGNVWSNIREEALSGTGMEIGTGRANTMAIVNQTTAIDGQSVCTAGAAFLCVHLVEGGYSDWYLPSRDELNKLRENQVAIGGFVNDPDLELDATIYWSSSTTYIKDMPWNAYAVVFGGGGGSGPNDKEGALRVRAVRSF